MQPKGSQAPDPALPANEARVRRITAGRHVTYNLITPQTFNEPGGKKCVVMQSPAIVTWINADGSVRLTVFGPLAHPGAGGIELVPAAREWDSPEPPQPGTWSWPILTGLT
jgi:hypothetical protein